MSSEKVIQFPKGADSGVPGNVEQAAYELMGFTLKSSASEMRFDLQGARIGDLEIGDWEIIVRQVKK